MISESRIAAQLVRLPTLPVSYYRIVRLANDPRSSAADFEKAMTPDPPLTANVLRLANSAFFGVPRTIASIRHAVTMLGTMRVVQAALGAAMRKVVPSVLPGYGMRADEFWRHSVAVAVLTSRIAEKRDLHDPGTAFTAGLLHDIGKLVTGVFLAEEMTGIMAKMQQEGKPMVTAEQIVLGVDHARVGVLVAEKWQLPPVICQAVRYHHEPSEATSERALVDLVHVTNCLAHGLGQGTDVGELHRRIDETAMDRLKLTSRSLEEVAAQVLPDIEDMADSLGLGN